jgi:hypothetical protein
MGRDPGRPSTPQFAEFAEALTRARARAEQREVELTNLQACALTLAQSHSLTSLS